MLILIFISFTEAIKKTMAWHFKSKFYLAGAAQVGNSATHYLRTHFQQRKEAILRSIFNLNLFELYGKCDADTDINAGRNMS